MRNATEALFSLADAGFSNRRRLRSCGVRSVGAGPWAGSRGAFVTGPPPVPASRRGGRDIQRCAAWPLRGLSRAQGRQRVAAIAALCVPAPSSPGRPKALAARRPARLLPPAPQPPCGPLSLRSPPALGVCPRLRPSRPAPGSGAGRLARQYSPWLRLRQGGPLAPASRLWPCLCLRPGLGGAALPGPPSCLAPCLASSRHWPSLPFGRSGRRVGLACGACVASLLVRAAPAGGAAPCGGRCPPPVAGVAFRPPGVAPALPGGPPGGLSQIGSLQQARHPAE